MSSSLTTTLSVDHLVLTITSLPQTIEFYTSILGMTHTSFTPPAGGPERHALTFGIQKINLHVSGHEFEPKADNVAVGSGDLCFLVRDRVDDILVKLKEKGVQVLEDGEVVERTGAQGKIRSVYVRDPDGNLIE